MTALHEYDRLECPGLWRETSGAQRREVIVSFGEASLVISDVRARALTHWSLAAVTRLNPGRAPALFTPAPDTDEVLEIDDDVMIAAIERVRSAIERARPRHGRLRALLLGGGLALVLAAMVLWVPGAMRRQTVAVVPTSVRTDIGAALLSRIGRIGGKPCTNPDGSVALKRLGARLLGAKGGTLVVLPAGIASAAHLPGRVFLLNRALVEDYEDADVIAGFVLAEDARATARDPLDRMLKTLGPLATFRLLTTGALPPAALDRYAEILAATPPMVVSDRLLLDRFSSANVPTSPYAYALDLSGEKVLGLIEADPMRGKPRAPVLSDANWVRLQGICGE